jgi:excisionase family DNA binding protein
MVKEAGMVVRIENKIDLTGKEIMTAGEVGLFLKVSDSAVRRWTREKKLKGYKLGGKGDWRYLKTDVIEFLLGQ